MQYKRHVDLTSGPRHSTAPARPRTALRGGGGDESRERRAVAVSATFPGLFGRGSRARPFLHGGQ